MLAQTLTHAPVLKVPNLLPVVRELPGDLETPVSVYLKLAGHGPSFLLESVTGGEQLARYSFIGVDCYHAYTLQGDRLLDHDAGRVRAVPLAAGQDPLDVLRQALEAFTPAPVPGLPRFAGGLVGYLGYDTARYFEPGLARGAGARGPVLPQGIDLPEAIFLLVDTVVAFDHAFGRLLLIANVRDEGDERAARAIGEQRLDDLQRRLSEPLALRAPAPAATLPAGLASNMTQAEYCAAVEQAKEHIAAGDIFQVVLAQRFSRRTSARPFDIYRSLRRLNPSPYMFFFDFDGLTGEQPLQLIGASPEMHVRLDAPAPDGAHAAPNGRTTANGATRRATIRPIAGTRPRGRDVAADLALERELLADDKERAEHVMLVDLARNDLGRVCDYGSVHVTELMGVERYSHVMHIVSQVEGTLRAKLDAFDLMKATFPAGTVSGAPKIRAMQIIRDLEPDARGPYAGAVGYFSYDGSSDTCITIRTLVMQGDTVYVQAGAGIVADSEPQREYQESVNKAQALAVAVQRAEQQVGR